MDRILATLADAIQGAAPVAAPGAFLWGILSVVLSPCHLASIPLVVAFIGQQGTLTTRRAFTISVVFAAGILVTIAAVGGVTALLGRMLGDVGPYVNYGVALVFLLLGLHFLGVIPLPWWERPQSATKRRGIIGAFLLGLFFGIGVGPCTFAFMAPMLGVTFKAATVSWLYGVVLLLMYGIGHCSVIVAAGTSVQRVQRYLDWSEGSKAALVLRRSCGVLILLGGLYLVFTAR
jgi:cytochrome c-type biogenesis protein